MPRGKKSANEVKLSKQKAEWSAANKMKEASDRQFMSVTLYDVWPKDGDALHPIKRMTMEEFTAWAGRAARMYSLMAVRDRHARVDGR